MYISEWEIAAYGKICGRTKFHWVKSSVCMCSPANQQQSPSYLNSAVLQSMRDALLKQDRTKTHDRSLPKCQKDRSEWSKHVCSTSNLYTLAKGDTAKVLVPLGRSTPVLGLLRHVHVYSSFILEFILVSFLQEEDRIWTGINNLDNIAHPNQYVIDST